MPYGPQFSLHDIPFSSFGSWLSLSPVLDQHRRSDDLHLISHHQGMHPVLRLTPHADGRPQPTEWHAAPTLLTWSGPHGSVEAAFENAQALRLRGQGLDLRVASATDRLTPFTGTYFFRDPVDGSHVFTSYETGRRYRVTVLRGQTARVAGDQSLGEARRELTLSAAPLEEGWEAVIEAIETARPPGESSVPHERVVACARRAFDDYAHSLIPWANRSTPAAELASYVLWSATVAPTGFVQRPAVLMSKHWMNKVWSWDHCFNALALAEADPQLALDQFLLPFDHQDEAGALPDSVTHSEVLHNFVKPPIHGWALARLRRTITLNEDQLLDIYGRLERWTQFWLTARRGPGQRLPHYQHGNDSGWDNATAFDAHRTVVTADLTAFLVLQLDELAVLARELDRHEDAVQHTKTADALLDALLTELWNGSCFAARSAHGDAEPVTSDSLLHLMPIVLGERLPQPVSDRLAEDIAAHLTPYGLATELPGSPQYEADGYWRGPIWAPATVLIEDGLRRAGHTALADTISARFRNLCETHGFAENFDALTGEGLRDRAYTWTAAGYLLLARDHVRRTTGTARHHQLPNQKR